MPWSLYLKSELLEKEEAEGAITIENEEEIFIDKPVSEGNVEKELVKRLEELRERIKEFESLQGEKEELKNRLKEAETQKELSGEALEEKNSQISQLSQQIEEMRVEGDNLKEKHNQLRINVSSVLYPEIEGAALAENDRELVNQTRAIVKKLNDLKTELDKEKGWWDKWINDMKSTGENDIGLDVSLVEPSVSVQKYSLEIGGRDKKWVVFEIGQHKEGRKIIKSIYEYYKNK